MYINLLFILASANKNGNEETTKKQIRKTCESRDFFKKINAIIDKPSRIMLASRPQYILLKKNTVLCQNLVKLAIFPIAKDDADMPPYPRNILLFTISESPRENK